MRLYLVMLLFPVGLCASSIVDSINQRNLSWKAEKNWISELSQEERQRLLGAKRERHRSHFEEREEPSNFRAPHSFSWTDVNGENFSSPVLHQGSCGSCVAFAAIMTLETQVNISRQTPSSPWQYSPQHLFACGSGSCSSGWRVGSAMYALEYRGVADSQCFPYLSGATGKDYYCSSACADASGRSQTIQSWSRPTWGYHSVSAIKAALLDGPLVTTFDVYEDFYYYKSGVYRHVEGDYEGGHAVSIVGWDGDEEAWIVKNSWGTTWGDAGYVKVAWEGAGIDFGTTTYAMEVADQEGFVFLKSLRDNDVLSGNVRLEVVSTFAGTTKTEWQLKRRGRSVPIAWGRGAETLQSKSFADGEYDLLAVAHHRSGKSESHVRHVKLLNGQLSGTLEMTNVEEGDEYGFGGVEKIKVEISINSSPVQITRLEFRATNVATGETRTKHTTNIASAMMLKWKIEKLERGEYELQLVGFAKDQMIQSDTLTVFLRE